MTPFHPHARYASCVGLLILLTGLSAGCGDDAVAPETTPDGALFHTDRTSYEAVRVSGEGSYTRYGFTVVTVFHNPSVMTAYLDRCSPDSPEPMYAVYAMEVEDDALWGAAYNSMWACVGHDRPIAVEPGERRTDTLRITGPNAWDGATGEPYGTLEGRFRLRYFARLGWGDARIEAPRSMRESNEFEVRVER